MLLEDGTYYVLESGGELVACGGWSRRGKLYTGSGDAGDDGRLLDPATEPARVRAMFVRADWTRRGLGRRILEECEAAARREGFRQLALVATLPGLPLYLAYGFERARGRRGDAARRRRARRRRDGEADRLSQPGVAPAGAALAAHPPKGGFAPCRGGRSLEHAVLADPAARLEQARAGSRCSVLDRAPGAWSPSSTRSASARRCGTSSRSGSTTTSCSRAGVACVAARRPRRARPRGLDRDGRSGARLGHREHGLDVHGRDLADPPFPSLADIGFLAVYPPAYVAIVLLLRSRVKDLRSSLWLDGVISGLAVGAVGTAVIFPAILDAVGGASRAAVTTNIAYPLLDLTLIGMVVWALAVTGWRPGRTWGLVAAGLLVFSISDCLYLYETAVGTYTNGSPTDLGWVAGCVLLAWAAWQPRERASRRRRSRAGRCSSRRSASASSALARAAVRPLASACTRSRSCWRASRSWA